MKRVSVVWPVQVPASFAEKRSWQWRTCICSCGCCLRWRHQRRCSHRRYNKHVLAGIRKILLITLLSKVLKWSYHSQNLNQSNCNQLKWQKHLTYFYSNLTVRLQLSNSQLLSLFSRLVTRVLSIPVFNLCYIWWKFFQLYTSSIVSCNNSILFSLQIALSIVFCLITSSQNMQK